MEEMSQRIIADLAGEESYKENAIFNFNNINNS